MIVLCNTSADNCKYHSCNFQVIMVFWFKYISGKFLTHFQFISKPTFFNCGQFRIRFSHTQYYTWRWYDEPVYGHEQDVAISSGVSLGWRRWTFSMHVDYTTNFGALCALPILQMIIIIMEFCSVVGCELDGLEISSFNLSSNYLIDIFSLPTPILFYVQFTF